MNAIFNPLFLTTISIGFIHTILGPDHYLPFVALSKSNCWSYRKTMLISTACGLAHCLSSVLIGACGIGLGLLIQDMEFFESLRGDIASYLMIAFGLIYLIWSLKKLVNHKRRPQSPLSSHSLLHSHERVNAHRNDSNLYWGIFIVFLFGPCEPLIPLLMYPAAKSDMFSVVTVSLVFTIVTVVTMLLAISLGLQGLTFARLRNAEKYSHSLASVTIIACGISIALGL